MTTDSKTIPTTLIAGDGIGPEIVESVIEILDAVGAPFEWDRQLAGMAGVDAVNDPLPKQTIESIRRTGLALKGPLTTPVGGGFKSINVTLRQEFGLFANLRPTKTIVPGGKFDKIDLVLFRENLEGYYAAMEHYIPVGEDPKGIALSSGFNSRTECRRIVKYAFEYAVKNNRKTVTIVHKANILKLLTGLFLEEGRKVAEEYKGRVAFNERIVDACAMQLVINPWQFDVIVTTNLFGDILSDLTAGLVGGLGMAPGANIGEKAAVFEAVHGSAPDIAGKGIANPLALLLAAVMMLQHVGRQDLADRIDLAIKKVITDGGLRTKDLGGDASTKDLTAALKQQLV
ncbi:isocitrate/isopropylmalate dehydrogenase family protein [Acetobacter indonesiensis]|uniref:Isocitrate dehydrogenase n=1 Tax=Acetobacter indonesiensis TaxID=104101 RepID=A0A252AWF5_9PROT|nr:isocitrate/isopropylmalate family dehydrogenase [Acetobacter indonesiensis]MCG0996201.1 isocitrate/isopropylmalate family dehydrogenase [Acetobacter indonesiensis]MCI1438270.1 isocitrate/isopropylmalate family dehydrogenase [Acetobacter indonesiensis]MCI1545232.1 isocitrate/isopropylmalate family dehydrogenase [Acetobacter indonesiensis]MCI1764524.1 isocitrate/isopropylmalate family dehydrogenase [Acetobacter indonesiensis]MCP1230444.1 isocitrate/isopropylmalate family dehydrogenase [Acetob